MEPKYYDVIVVGAGPAGSISAYHLAERGYQVLILEKEYFPRHKPCGGGLTYRALELLPFDISSVVEREVYSFRFTHRFRKAFIRHSDKPLMMCVMRDRFDLLLLNQAREKGADYLEGIKVTGFTETFDKVLVHAGGLEFAASFVIGADGVNSLTARTYLLNDCMKKGIGIESELRVHADKFEPFRQMVCLDWGTFVEGYAWVFPKADHLSVGVGGPVELAKYLKKYYLRFIESLDVGDVEILSFRTYPIPYRTGYSRVQASRVMVTGDAAGLTDPMTGEGIYYALKSGKIAASVIMEYLEGSTLHPYGYRERLENEVISELMAAIPLLRVFNAAPAIIHHSMKKHGRIWRGFCQVLRGEVNYSQFRSKMGRYAMLWTPLIQLATIIEWVRRMNYKARRLKIG